MVSHEAVKLDTTTIKHYWETNEESILDFAFKTSQ